MKQINIKQIVGHNKALGHYNMTRSCMLKIYSFSGCKPKDIVYKTYNGKRTSLYKWKKRNDVFIHEKAKNNCR